MPKGWMDYRDKNGRKILCPRICESDEGEKIKEMVLKRLQQAADAGRWKLAGVHKPEVIVVCSKYNEEGIVGKFVVERIKAFLEMGDELVVHDDCHGFVVDSSGGPPLLLPEETFRGYLDAHGEAENGLWQQLIDGVSYQFGAEDIPTAGLLDWKVFLKDGAVPMARRKVLQPEV